MQEVLIYCPLCKWKPPKAPLWVCLPVCGHKWDTFETSGQCPKCGEQFERTNCPSCKQFPLHKNWYHYPQKLTPREKKKEVVLIE